MKALELLINIIHLIFILTLLILPFSKDFIILRFHQMIILFMSFHWITNDDTCCLTELEKLVTNKKTNNETFIGKIVGPVYKITNFQIKLITFVLYFISELRIQNFAKTDPLFLHSLYDTLRILLSSISLRTK